MRHMHLFSAFIEYALDRRKSQKYLHHVNRKRWEHGRTKDERNPVPDLHLCYHYYLIEMQSHRVLYSSYGSTQALPDNKEDHWI